MEVSADAKGNNHFATHKGVKSAHQMALNLHNVIRQLYFNKAEKIC